MSEEVELAWMAGLLEGEAHPGWKKSHRTPIVYLRMNDQDVMERFLSWINRVAPAAPLEEQQNRRGQKEKPYRLCLVHDKRANHNDGWTVQVTSRRAVVLMKLIRPYMGQRRTAQIDRALRLQQEKESERRESDDTHTDP